MSSQVKSLIWKEWQEQKRFFWIFLISLVGLTTIFLLFKPELGFIVYMVACLGAFYLGLLVAVHVIVHEKTKRTDQFCNSLPVSRTAAALVKLGMGAFVLLAPLAIFVVYFPILFWFLRSTGHISSQLINELHVPDNFYSHFRLIGLTNLWVAGNVYLWVTAFATRFDNYIKAGSYGIALLFSWGLYSYITLLFVGHLTNPIWTELVISLNAINPLFPYFQLELGHAANRFSFRYALINPTYLAQLATALWLIRRWVKLYGTEAKEGPKDFVERFTTALSKRWTSWQYSRHSATTTSMCLAQHKKQSPTKSLIWQQWRQLRLLLLCLLGIGLFITLFPLAHVASETVYGLYDPRFTKNISQSLYHFGRDALQVLFLMVGLPAMMILGTATFTYDRSLNIQSYWRTLPISAGRAFFVKFVASFCMSYLCLMGPFLLVAITTNAYGHVANEVFRGTLFLLAHFTIAVCFFWVISNPLQSITLAAAYSVLIQIGIFPMSQSEKAINQIVSKEGPSIPSLFLVTLLLLLLPPAMVLLKQFKSPRLTTD